MHIVFSILVHESVKCVISLINNIKKFCPNVLIIIHISNNEFDDTKIQNIDNVFINPTRNIFLKKTDNGILLYYHISNYKYICEEIGKENISNFAFMASNEMIIKDGLEEHIRKYKNGLQCVCYNQFIDWHIYNKFIQHTQPVKKMLEMLDMNTMWGGQTEGQFFELDVMDKICDVYEKCFANDTTHYPLDNIDYPLEEIIPQTVFMSMEKSLKCPNFTLQTYSHSQEFTIDIINILKDEKNQDKNISLQSLNRLCLSTPHAGNTIKYIFSVKRIERKENDPLRVFIDNL